MATPEVVELAKKAKMGNVDAFEDLCKIKQRSIAFSAYMKLGNYQDAEDATQETIILMYKHICKLKNPEAIDAWIEKITRTCSIRILRKRKPQAETTFVEDEIVEIPEDDREFLPEEYAEDEALRDKLFTLVTELSYVARETIILYYYKGMSYKEISEIMGTSVKTVSTNLIGARKTLKKKLTKMEEQANKAALMAIPATSTVLGRVLEAESIKILPAAKMAAIGNNWQTAIHAMPMPAAHGLHVLSGLHGVGGLSVAKIAVCVVLATSVITGGVAVSGGFSQPVADVSTNTVVAATADGLITFSGADCECGHINPHGMQLSGLAEGETLQSFEIENTADGSVIFAGNEADLNAELTRMADEEQEGEYKIVCRVNDKNGNEFTIKRNFVIGNYAGDKV
ncbi:MAG: sigma-70 family RNA polymerase sigma factor [Clostridiales Family XIII bacterium]|nr:sigma-70 family RNA polymerase sigma factor [Clostridiales Family XIII bacterium]